MTDKEVTLGLRLGVMILDHFIMCVMIVPPLIVTSLIDNSDQAFETTLLEKAAFSLMMLVYLNKDFFRAKSIAKRILGLRIVDHQTGESANELQCFLRNMTIPIWPLEVLVSLFSPKRRFGDFIANTRVEITCKEKANSILQDLKKTKLTPMILWTLAIGIVYMGLLWYLMDNIMNI